MKLHCGPKSATHGRAASRFNGRQIGTAAMLLAGVLFSASAAAVDSFTASYGNGSNCGSSFTITGREPSTAGTYPVFLYMVGTTESATNASAIAAITGMANRGYVAATIAYPNSTFGGCSTISGRAQCIFNPNSTNSAVSKLCARAKADCSKGIVVGGFSQGSVIATLAKNFDSRVRAAYGLGEHAHYSSFDLSSCMNNGNHALASTNLRMVNGQADSFVGGTLSASVSDAQQVTGLSCGTGATSCLRSDGSGWIIVLNNQVQDGSADHCYMRASGGCSGSQNSLDQGWANGTAAWELNPNLDWLSTRTAH
ncbi:MAG: hypothetical protein ACJ8J7_01760 [Sulfurifustaceae bacterium]